MSFPELNIIKVPSSLYDMKGFGYVNEKVNLFHSEINILKSLGNPNHVTKGFHKKSVLTSTISRVIALKLNPNLTSNTLESIHEYNDLLKQLSINQINNLNNNGVDTIKKYDYYNLWKVMYESKFEKDEFFKKSTKESLSCRSENISKIVETLSNVSGLNIWKC